jgi:hypothetical protein
MEFPFQVRSSGRGNNPLNHTRRTWTGNNGVHYTMETASYATPGFSFHAVNGGANGIFDDFFSPGVTRRQTAPVTSIGTGLFGTALNLLGDMAAAHHQHTHIGGNRGRRIEIEDLNQVSEEEDVDMGNNGSGRPKSIFSRFVEKLADNQRNTRRGQPNRSTSPPRQRPENGRHGPFDTEDRQSAWGQRPRAAFVKEDDDAYPEYEHRPQRPRQNNRRSSSADMIAALENAVQHHANEVRRCKKQLERATRQQQIHSGQLQAMLNELKSNEAALTNATRSLQAAKNNSSRRQSSCQQQRPSFARQFSSDEDDDEFDFSGFQRFRSRPSPATHDPFAHLGLDDDPFASMMFGNVHRHFATFGGMSPFDEFFAMPGGTFAGSTFANANRKRHRTNPMGNGQARQANPMFTSFNPAPPRPPSTLMTPDEAKSLFKTYNERWNSLSPADSNVPYPSRGLQPSALLARDTLWAPQVSSHPSTWSEETVMQANVQLFFLHVVGLIPHYTESPGTGRVDMGFDKTQASPDQVRQLIEILKKEKTRWHSDRLGRRNGGVAGANEGLQQDERARAVFHAVCELMETAQ